MLGVPVHYLEQIVFCVLKDHKDALGLENDLDETNDIFV